MDTRIAELSDSLYRELNASRHHWLLLDPLLRPFADDSPLGACLKDRELLLLPVSGHLDPAQMPFLVRFSPELSSDHDLVRACLNEAIDELAPAALALGGGRRIGAWLESECDGPTLARHLGRQMIQPRGNRRHWLRWHDPAVFWSLWPILDPGQQSRLLGPLTGIRLLDPRGKWTKYLPEEAATDNGPLQLSDAQWQQIDHIATFNDYLRDTAVAAEATEPGQLRDICMAAYARAAELGFRDREDLRAFGHYTRTVGAGFERHPLLAGRLENRDGNSYFTALIDDLGEAQWLQIQHDLAGHADV